MRRPQTLTLTLSVTLTLTLTLTLTPDDLVAMRRNRSSVSLHRIPSDLVSSEVSSALTLTLTLTLSP